MKKLWTRGGLFLAAAVWLLGSWPVTEDLRVYAAEGSNPSAAQIPVNINTATDQELQALPGIGPATAKRIVEYRSQFGPFSQAAEVQNVTGIGPIKFEKMKLQIKT